MKENLIELFREEPEIAVQITGALPIAIYVTDTEGKLQYYNSAAAYLSGGETELDTDQWLESWILQDSDRNPIPPEESPVTIALKEKRSIKDEEVWIERPDGERICFKTDSIPLRSEEGEVIGGVHIFTDISSHKKNISELKNAIETRQQKRLYEVIISSTPDLVYVFDLNYRFTFVNEALLEMWDKSYEESIGKSLLEVGYEPWHAEMHEREIDQVAETKKPLQGEVSFPHAKLGERYYDYIFVPIFDEDGEVEKVGGITRDVTERKQAEQALRTNEEKYRTLVKNFPNGAVGLFDQNLRYTALGGELVKAMGVDPEERLGNKITDIYPEEIMAEVEPHFQATLAGEAKSFEAEYHDRKLFAQTLPIKSEEGEITSGMLVVQDITERWEAQRDLRKSEEKYRTLFETMEEGFCILDLEFDDENNIVDFRYQEVNASFGKHTGLKNIEGKKATEIGVDPKDDWIKTYGKVALTGEPEHFEYYVEEMDRWFEISAFRIGEAKEQKVAGLFNNITGRKRAQEKLRAMKENLEEQVEERTKSLVSYQNKLRSLVAELSKAEEQERQNLASELHDNLGQMLALGKMKIAQIKQESLPESTASKLEELAELIEDANKYTRDLTSDLKPPSFLNDEDLKEYISWVAEKMKKHDLEVRIEDDKHPKPLDKEVLMTLLQCVRELLFNVIKHTSVNEALVSLKRHEDQVNISVRDEGEGFDRENTESSSREKGFGLFSIRERIDMLGGEMKIDSTPGEGTDVNLFVPLEGSSVEYDRTGEPRQPDRPEKIKVLLADNHRMVREGLRSIIEKEDDMIVTGEAVDAEETVQLSRENSPDVIIMEASLPDAIEATENILAGDSQIRIIGLSEQEDEKVARNIRDAGAIACLSKKEAYKSLASSIRAEAYIAKK